MRGLNSRFNLPGATGRRPTMTEGPGPGLKLQLAKRRAREHRNFLYTFMQANDEEEV